VLAGGALAGLAALGVALLFNPAVLGQYWHTLGTRPPAQYRSPTLGTLVRLALGGGSFRWQFLALLPGLAWFVPHWLRHPRDWDWPIASSAASRGPRSPPPRREPPPPARTRTSPSTPAPPAGTPAPAGSRSPGRR